MSKRASERASEQSSVKPAHEAIALTFPTPAMTCFVKVTFSCCEARVKHLLDSFSMDHGKQLIVSLQQVEV